MMMIVHGGKGTRDALDDHRQPYRYTGIFAVKV